MEGIWLISYVILWGIVLLLVVVVLAHSRLLGLLHHRFGPAAARPLADGPDIGTEVSEIFGLNIRNEKWSIGFPSDKEVVVIFISPQCSTCNEVLPHIADFSRTENSLNVVLMSTIDDMGMNQAYAAYKKLEKLTYVINEKLSDELSIDAVPYALYLNTQGVIMAKGLVNNYENLKGLKKSPPAMAKNRPISEGNM